jgi:hypothetical protein
MTSQEKLVEILDKMAHEKSATEAYVAVMKPEHELKSPDADAHNYLQRNKKSIIELLDEQGLTLKYANSHLQDILERPTKSVLNSDGVEVKLEDKSLRLAGLTTLYKLHKALGIDSLTINAQQNNFQLDVDNVNKLDQVANTFLKLNQRLIDTKDVQDGEIS